MGEPTTTATSTATPTAINTAYTPALIVLDGLEVFTARGPMAGRRVAFQVVLAGTDRVAIDTVGMALLRYYHTTTAVANGPIFEQIARAVELGLGVDSSHKIRLVTDDADSAAYAEEIKKTLWVFLNPKGLDV
jgi:uncharacterized protein (DUF362 family)